MSLPAVIEDRHVDSQQNRGLTPLSRSVFPKNEQFRGWPSDEVEISAAPIEEGVVELSRLPAFEHAQIMFKRFVDWRGEEVSWCLTTSPGVLEPGDSLDLRFELQRQLFQNLGIRMRAAPSEPDRFLAMIAPVEDPQALAMHFSQMGISVRIDTENQIFLLTPME